MTVIVMWEGNVPPKPILAQSAILVGMESGMESG